MSVEIKKEVQLEIAHVLFMDIVGYSKLLINEQRTLLSTLNQIVRGTDEFRSAEAAQAGRARYGEQFSRGGEHECVSRGLRWHEEISLVGSAHKEAKIPKQSARRAGGNLESAEVYPGAFGRRAWPNESREVREHQHQSL